MKFHYHGVLFEPTWDINGPLEGAFLIGFHHLELSSNYYI
jgi:hypothetical protein